MRRALLASLLALMTTPVAAAPPADAHALLALGQQLQQTAPAARLALIDRPAEAR